MKTTANTCANDYRMCTAGTGWGEEISCENVLGGGWHS